MCNEVMERNPMDGSQDGARSIPRPANPCTSLQHHLGYNNKPKMIVTTVVRHMATTTNICMKGMTR